MSFAFMPVYTGDYLRDTRHLTPLKHGIYFLLLMHCWDQKGPVPLDEQECAGIVNCRSADEVEALRYVLNRYFVRMEDGWYNKRMAEEVARAENISRNNSAAGKKSAQARAAIREKVISTRAQRVLNASSTGVGTPTPTPTPTTTTTTAGKPPLPPKPAKEGRTVVLPAWVKPEDWKAYIDHRVRMHKPMTEEAQRRALAELGRLRSMGNDPGAVITQSLTRGWAGLFEVKSTSSSTHGQIERVAAMLFGQSDEGVIDG